MLLLLSVLITTFGHIFTEYTLQKTKLGIYKRKSFLGLLLHATLWTVAICLGLLVLGILAPWKVFFLLTTHTLIDFMKMKLVKGSIRATHPVNITDQSLHLLTIIITYIK